jgi:hypothetical protein
MSVVKLVELCVLVTPGLSCGPVIPGDSCGPAHTVSTPKLATAASKTIPISFLNLTIHPSPLKLVNDRSGLRLLSA